MNHDDKMPHNFLDRSPLLARLDSALAYRLTLLIAPAGYGKSVLLREWADSLNRPTAWVSLDERDDEPARFLSHLAAALQTVAPEIVKVIQAEADDTGESSLNDRIVDLINALAAVQEDFILVLDNYHAIDAPSVHGLVEILLDYPPPQMHLVIATRTPPPLPLPRLRVRRQLLTLELHSGPASSRQY